MTMVSAVRSGTAAIGETNVRGLARVRGGAVELVRKATDIALPPQCLSCDAPLADHGSLCPRCWAKLRLIEKPYCARLGIPFAYDLGPGALSAEAIADPPPFDRCRAVATYDDVARALVHGLKYRDRLDLAGWMAQWMLRAGADLLTDAAVVVPVPLHRRRLWRRRFNQSAQLGRVVAEAADKPFRPLALARVRHTAQQVGLSASERNRNVQGAFQVPPAARMDIAGRRVLLVDDVFTTGATARAATRALLRGGAAAVDVLVFARVVAGQS
jgi:ComF family protein